MKIQFYKLRLNKSAGSDYAYQWKNNFIFWSYVKNVALFGIREILSSLGL